MSKHRVGYSLVGMCYCFNVFRSEYYSGCGVSPANGFNESGTGCTGQISVPSTQATLYPLGTGGSEILQRKMPKENGRTYNLKTIAASLKYQDLVAEAIHGERFDTREANFKQSLALLELSFFDGGDHSYTPL